MIDFNYYNPARIIYGQDSLTQLSENLPELGNKVLLHYGQSSIKRSGLYDAIVEILNLNGIEYIDLGGVKPNPEFDLVAEGLRLVKKHQVTGILAVGGGSVIDSAKGIAAGALYDGDIEDAFYHNENIEKALPLGVVLTIPAAGSESSSSAVVTVRNNTHKRSIKGEALIPKFAIVNPALFTTLSKAQAAAGFSDIFSHLLERYFTHTENVDYTDRLLEATMRTMVHYGPHLVNHLDDVSAWSEVGFAGTLAHNGLLGSGRQEDWASHRIEHELSTLYDIPHGVGLAIVFPAWMRYVNPNNKKRFVQFAQRVFGVDYAVEKEDMIIEKGIVRFEQFLKDMDLPTRLHEIGITQDDSDVLIERAFEGRPDQFGNFMKLSREDMRNILNLAK